MAATLTLSSLLCLLPVVMDVASFAASASLLFWVWSLDKPHSEKLMPRQLWHLSLADLIFVVLDMLWWIPDVLRTFFGIGIDTNAHLDVMCKIGFWSAIGSVTSMLIEVHIALATGFAICRCSPALHALAGSLPLVWLVTLALAVCACLLEGASWNVQVGSCDSGMGGQVAQGAFTVAVVATCFGAYIGAATYAEQHAGNAVKRRIGKRAKLFLGAAVISWTPSVVFFFISPEAVPGGNRNLYYVAFSLSTSNGLLNAFAYSWQCRLYRQTRQRPSNGRRIAAAGRTPISLCVGFAGSDHAIAVPESQKVAHDRAEEEIGDLESLGASTARDVRAVRGPGWFPQWRRCSNALAEEEFLDCFEDGEVETLKTPTQTPAELQ